MEIAGRDETLRRFTDNRGRFQFSDLRPGEWTVRVAGEGIPEYHYPERDSVRVTILPGEKKETPFRILPKKRIIRILQEGNIHRESRPPVVSPAPGSGAEITVPGKKAPSPSGTKKSPSQGKKSHARRKTASRYRSGRGHERSDPSGRPLAVRR